MRAREVDARLADRGGAGAGGRPRATLREVAGLFEADLARRADAGELAPGTARRYRAALGHVLAFAEQPHVCRQFPHAGRVDRAFRVELEAFLAERRVPPNGHPNAAARPLRGPAFILDAARAMLQWAADPDRGGLLPEGHRNPFLRCLRARPAPEGDPLAEPDVTLAMAVELVGACDRYQLRLLAPLLLFGLRASEPRFLFREHVGGGWLRAPCLPALGYSTKGRRDKRFPLIDDLRPLWGELGRGPARGLLYERRGVEAGRERAPLRGASLDELAAELRARCQGGAGAAARRRARDAVLREAGGLTYDHVQGELAGLARRLGWPAAATLKDLRHLFATAMNNAGMPEAYRRYLLGHAPARAALSAYTHLNELARHYAEAVRREWGPLVEAVLRRLSELPGEG